MQKERNSVITYYTSRLPGNGAPTPDPGGVGKKQKIGTGDRPAALKGDNMARLPVGYRQRKDGRIECRFILDGKRYSCYADTVKECREKERNLREEIANGSYTQNKNLTLDKYYEEWKNARKGSIKGNTALGNSSRYKNHIKPVLGHKKLIEIEKREIVQLQQKLAEKMEPSTVNAVMAQIKSILNDAVAEGILVKSPAAGVKLLKVEKKATETYHRALTEEEQKLFMQEAKKEWLYELLALLLCTGMRVGEATALTWQDIDYKCNVIHVTKTISRTAEGTYTVGTPKSKTGVRDIPLNDGIKAVLKSQKEKQNMIHGNVIKLTQPVFENLYGGMVYNASVNKTITETLKRINKDKVIIEHFSAHALRDTFATRYIEQGGSPQVLKTILGHSSLAMTMDLYSHVLPNTKQKEMDSIKIAF